MTATTATPRRSPRYTVRVVGDQRVVLHSTDATVCAALGHYLSDEITRTYWVPRYEGRGGYVREITEHRPGTLGQQVCDGLAHGGNALTATPGSLARVIRRELRAALRAAAHVGY